MDTIPSVPPPAPPASWPSAPNQPPMWVDSRLAVPFEPRSGHGEHSAGDPIDPTFPGIGISIGWIVMYFALQIAVSIPVLVIAALFNPSLRSKLTSGNMQLTQEALLNASGGPILVALVLSGLITVGILWLHLRKNHRYRVIGLFARSKMSVGDTIGYGVGLMIGALIISALYSNLVLNGKDSQADTTAIIKGLDSPVTQLIGFLAIVIVAPVVEELLFRGYLQTALSRRMKPWMAIAVSSLVFGAIHFQPLALPMLAGLGAVFGYLYYRTGSLKVNIALHMANNALAFLAMLAAARS